LSASAQPQRRTLCNISPNPPNKIPGWGDFNSKHTLWGSRLITTTVHELAKLIQTNNFSYLSTGSPTYWPTDPNKTPDLLDFFITYGIPTNYAEVEASYDLTSDHSPIIATISTTVMSRQPSPRLHTHQTNWDTYKSIIRENVEPRPKLKTREILSRQRINLSAPYNKQLN